MPSPHRKTPASVALRRNVPTSDPQPTAEELEESEARDDTAASSSARPRKRARTSLTLKRTKKQPPKVSAAQRNELIKQDLMRKFFDILPLDIVFEIFGLLHPHDLLRLSRTNKALRKILTSKSSLPMWKRARSSVYKFPDCPPDQSEMQWAQLIFEKDCMICWEKDQVRKVDWTLRLRACPKCMREIRVYRTHTYQTFSYATKEEIDDALNLLPYSEVRTTSLGRVYSHTSITAMLETLEGFSFKVLANIRGAEEELEAFRVKTRTEAQAIMANGAEVEKWASVYNSGKAALRNHLLQEHRKIVRAKLLELGHDSRDVYKAMYWLKPPKEIADDDWEQNHAEYEALVDKALAQRLEMGHQRTIQERREIFNDLYQQYRINQGADLHPMTPKESHILWKFPLIDQILESPPGTIVTDDSFSEAMEALPDLLENWRRELKMELLKKLASGLDLILPDEAAEEQMAAELGRLEKASAVFICSRSHEPRVVSVHELPFHPCVRYNQQFFHRPEHWSLDCLSFDPTASKNVEGLVTCLGLDPLTATANDLDEVNARFYCEQCPASGRVLRSWRNCALHHLENPGTAELSTWVRISPELNAAVIEQELSLHSNDSLQRMRCRSCSDKMQLYSIGGLTWHIQSWHGKVMDPADFFPEPTIPAVPVRLKQKTEKNPGKRSSKEATNQNSVNLYACNQCPSSPNRLYDDFRVHFSSVHEAKQPKPDDCSVISVPIVA